MYVIHILILERRSARHPSRHLRDAGFREAGDLAKSKIQVIDYDTISEGDARLLSPNATRTFVRVPHRAATHRRHDQKDRLHPDNTARRFPSCTKSTAHDELVKQTVHRAYHNDAQIPPPELEMTPARPPIAIRNPFRSAEESFSHHRVVPITQSHEQRPEHNEHAGGTRRKQQFVST